MKRIDPLVLILGTLLIGGLLISCAKGADNTMAKPNETSTNPTATMTQAERNHENKAIIGMHVMIFNDIDADALASSLPLLAEKGINLMIVEVGYSYQYQSHPELGDPGALSFDAARMLAEKAREYGVEIVPEFNCLGHQSWQENTNALLSVYPELDETHGKYPNNAGIYCRSWCPLNENVNPIIFDLIDELMDAFEADSFHVGMDEVFIIADEDCPRCGGKDPGEVYAKQVNDLYQHITVEKGATMYMWADRLLDGAALDEAYSEWESSYNGTYTAIDRIPKDIILCDWHYEARDDYPSISYLLDAGFQVLTASWKDSDAAEKLITATLDAKKENKRAIGHIYTTWGEIGLGDLADWNPMQKTINLLK